VILARRVFRTGVQTLSYENGRYFVAIQNRTYRSRVEIAEAKVEAWCHALGGPRHDHGYASALAKNARA
jgi:hypothetical protein